MLGKRPNRSLPVLDQRGRGELSSENARMVPIIADRLHRLPCLFSLSVSSRLRRPSRPCSHHGGHFDADVLCHHGPRLPLLHHLHAVIMLPAAEAADAQPERCSVFPPASLVFIMDSGRGAFLSTYVLTLSN